MNRLRIFPEKLQPKDPVAIVAPASPFDHADLEKGKEVLASAGWNLVPAAHLYSEKGYLAGTDEDRAKDFNQAISDSTIRAIFCARGGYGSLRILPFLDVDLASANPKPLIGFSDNTALLMYFFKACGLISFSGPVVAGTQIGNMPSENLRHLVSLLSDPKYRGPVPGEGRCLVPGTCSGPLIGGNLTLLVHCLAAGVLPSLEKGILLIEDVNEAPYRIDRALTTLRLSGALDSISGVLAGSFIGVEAKAVDEILKDRLGDLAVPIVAGFPVGHGDANVPLPIGVNVTLDAGDGILRLEEGAVC